MRKILFIALVLTSVMAISQDKKPFEKEFKEADKAIKPTVEDAQKQAQQAVYNLQQFYDISAEGTLYPKGTFPRKIIDTVKIIALCSTLDKLVMHKDSVTSPSVFQKVLYVCSMPNSFTKYNYLDENKQPLKDELIIWQTKEIPKK